MHRPFASRNPYILILTKGTSKCFITSYLLTIGHMPMFVVISIVIQILKLMVLVIDYVDWHECWRA